MELHYGAQDFGPFRHKLWSAPRRTTSGMTSQCFVMTYIIRTVTWNSSMARLNVYVTKEEFPADATPSFVTGKLTMEETEQTALITFEWTHKSPFVIIIEAETSAMHKDTIFAIAETKLFPNTCESNKEIYERYTDVDECAYDGIHPILHDCDTEAWCKNTIGSYTCTCFEGYIGDGTVGNCEEDESYTQKGKSNSSDFIAPGMRILNIVNPTYGCYGYHDIIALFATTLRSPLQTSSGNISYSNKSGLFLAILDDPESWIQVNMTEGRFKVLGIYASGDEDTESWVSSVMVSTSSDGVTWEYINDTESESPMIFPANYNNAKSEVMIWFPLPIREQYMRIHVNTYDALPVLGFDIIGAFFNDCDDAYRDGFRSSDVFTVYQPKEEDLEEREPSIYFNLYCDMSTTGERWTVIQRRNLSGEALNFTRSWDEYKDGFGDLSSEFWLGMDKLREIGVVNRVPHVLRVDMVTTSGVRRHAMYTPFGLSDEDSGYIFYVGDYSGNAGDALSALNGAKFSTFDLDNTDPSGTIEGGWWYKNCTDTNLNKPTGENKGPWWSGLGQLIFVEMKTRKMS